MGVPLLSLRVTLVPSLPKLFQFACTQSGGTPAFSVGAKAWPIKTKAGTSIADLLAAEARKRADAREAAKPQAAILVVGDDDPSADF